jgi:C1A family cysteine protease
MRKSIFSTKIVPLLAVALVLLLCLLALTATVQAEEPPQWETADKLPEPSEPPPVLDGHGTGYIPPRMDLSHLTGRIPPGRSMVQQTPPDRLDWREEPSMVTPVQDQSTCGACYAFAALANIESKLLMDSAGTYDFSENNAKECNWQEKNGTYDNCVVGGNYFMMANWLSQQGTVLETCDPYEVTDVECTSGCAYQKTLLDWRIINGSGVADTNLLKRYIEDYGPVYTTMYAGHGANDWHLEFSAYDGSYTLYYTGTDTPNHAVLIVGWDESLEYDKGGGETGYGGWIVKNSWGTDWGGTCDYGSEKGYFYIAYESASIGTNSSFIYDWQDYDDNDEVWYYDEAGWTGSGGVGDTTCWGLCRFTPPSDAHVKRMEFWTTDVTTDVDLYIYDDFDGTNLSNVLWSSENHSFAEAGYHSVALGTPLDVTSGDDIFAVVKFTNDSYIYPLANDEVGPYETGRTYIYYAGTWYDLGAFGEADVAIRLRTGTYPYFLSSYSDSGHYIHCNDYSDPDTENVVYMYATDLTATYEYRVAYYDGNNDKVGTHDVGSDSSRNLSSHRTFRDAEPVDQSGTWHVIVCEQTQIPPDPYNDSWEYTLASDTFTVQGSAIPEFPTILAAIAALALCAGIYLWMRRKATPVPA